MKREIGVSIYPEKIGVEETVKYISDTKKVGATRLYATFLQLNMFSDNKNELVDIYKKCFYFAKNNGFKITLDVAEKTFKTLQVGYEDLTFFKELGVDRLRFDTIWDPKIISDLTYNLQQLEVEIQMSNDDNILDTILFYKPKIENLKGSHNFYPQRYTAMSLEQFYKTSEQFCHNKIRISSYLSSDNKFAVCPWLFNDGTPTLEMCRELPSSVQSQIYWATGLTDDLIFANSPVNLSEIKKIISQDPYIIQLEIELLDVTSSLEREIIFENEHFCRPDINEWFIRSTQTRVKYLENKNPPRRLTNLNFYEVGDVIIGNDVAGLYKNELQVITKRIPIDDKKNLVGRVKGNNLKLLNFINANKKFRFISP